MTKPTTVAVPTDLLKAIESALNQIPNKKLYRDDYPDTYALASAVGKLRR